jgi:hypothetical protein
VGRRASRDGSVRASCGGSVRARCAATSESDVRGRWRVGRRGERPRTVRARGRRGSVGAGVRTTEAVVGTREREGEGASDTEGRSRRWEQLLKGKERQFGLFSPNKPPSKELLHFSP